jgi:NarL family two-component system response regulator LiaR
VAGAVFHHLQGRAVPDDALTEREREVLRLVARGRTNREIADVLVVSAETVKTHVANILSKLGLANRTQIIIHALKQGIVDLDEIELDDHPA